MRRKFSNLEKAREMKRSKDKWLREHGDKVNNKITTYKVLSPKKEEERE